MKIPVKVIICYMVTVIVLFFCSNTFLGEVVKDRIVSDCRSELLECATGLADGYIVRFYDSKYTLRQMRDQVTMLSDILGQRIWVINSKNKVVVDSKSAKILDLDLVDPEFVYKTYHDDVMIDGVFDEKMLAVTAPVMYKYSVKAYVCVLMPVRETDEIYTRQMNAINIVLLIVCAFLAISFFVIYIIAAYPTRKIRKAALEYAGGNYSYTLKCKTHDEYNDLTEAINYMVGQIKQVDDYQKKFVANVSHDFRSPLTSIKGYAEAIKDGTVPEEARNKYLDVILFETDRLSKLTSDLLDLNRIDARGLMLDVTSFDINEAIKKTAASFEVTCLKKKINIELSFAEKSTFVDADLGRIQQVLYNLIDNAIKFSRAQTSIEIETEEKGAKALIRVKDHGEGISRENIKRIWERFYKQDSSRGKDKKGTGLGLSIVKEIIAAHDENINVISTEGVGTEFTFTLPISGG
ncbi:MAG: HAMP domain-containing histidine kinase [Lachnospiraceae bacterium]|nr:HAMP domain-containing histidine kinase [Lachnospiraceae bacterium]